MDPVSESSVIRRHSIRLRIQSAEKVGRGNRCKVSSGFKESTNFFIVLLPGFELLYGWSASVNYQSVTEDKLLALF